MKRRDFMSQSAGLGVLIATANVPNVLAGNFLMSEKASKLTAPPKGKIPVAFAISDGVTVIDFAGPWEVFQDVMIPQRGQDMDEQMPFELFTVSEKTEPLAGSAGQSSLPGAGDSEAPRKKSGRTCVTGSPSGFAVEF